MDVEERAVLSHALSKRRGQIVLQWQRAIAPTGYPALGTDEVRQRLGELLDLAVTVLLADEFDPACAQAVGVGLAQLHYLEPEAAGATQLVLAQELLASVPGECAAALFPRLTALLSAVAVGFGRQMRDAILREQEEIRAALMAQREQALRALADQYAVAERARSELRAVLDAAGDAMLLISLDRRALMVNRQFEVLFGMPEDSVIGRTISEFREHFDRIFVDPPALRSIFDWLTDTERQVTQTVLQRWPQPSELRLFSTPVRGTGGTLLGRLHVFRDVTIEREVDRMKSQIISLVSHELRTPLTSIKGYVELLLAGEVGTLSEEQQEFLQVVKNNADRQGVLLNNLLDLSRMEAGKVELSRRPVALAPLLNEVARSIRPQVSAKHQQLLLRLTPRLPAVSGDADRLNQVFTNLLSNAHKYTAEGGSITVTACPEIDWVRVDVQDTGIGLTEEDQQHVFDTFFRASNQVTRKVSGTGLGLAITRALVELHGGEVTVRSVLGVGSTFSVRLRSAEAR